MNKYLIFRTDRIGDFFLTLILIKCIKRNDIKSYIVVVSSDKNFEYIKTFNQIDKTFVFKKDFISRFKLIKELRKFNFNYSIIHDGKRRSLLTNFFLRKIKTITVDNANIKISHFKKIKDIIHKLDFIFKKSDLDILNDRISKYKNNQKLSYSILHYDEKWSNQTYISNYKNIEPSENELLKFVMDLHKKLNLKIIITTGIKTPNILKSIISKIDHNKVELIENIDFHELENLVSNSKLIISCHGSISHVAAASQIKQIDIIDDNYVNPYYNWTEHFRNYDYVYRNNFQILSKKILELI